MIKNNFKIIFAGGGTGGHLYSGIAVADLIRKNYPEAKILFVGTPFGLEKEIVPECGYDLKFVEASPLKGSGVWFRIKSLLRLPKAYFQSKKILKDFQPDIVMGIGGYASGPMTLAAHFNKVFTAIIEQNSYPGFTNRKLGRFVDKIFIAFEKAREFFPKEKIVLSGNPVRSFLTPPNPKPEKPFTVLILGGSQGAHILNQSMIEALPLLGEIKPELHFIHQTGKNDFSEVQEAYEKSGVSAEVFPFSQDLGPLYAKTHLAICRAGAGTIAELRLQGLPSILVPYPYATDDHQRFNAQEMVDQGAAELCLNADLNGKILAERIRYYLKHTEALPKMCEAAQAQAKPLAAQEVLNQCLSR